MHYSFDYAQQIHYPHYSQQVGPLFFKTPRKCQCFGVCAEGSGMYMYEALYNLSSMYWHVYKFWNEYSYITITNILVPDNLQDISFCPY